VVVTSAAVKSVDAALSENVTADVLLVNGVTVDGEGVIVMVGCAVSITIALAPPMLFVPLGTVVDVMAFPTVSSTVPIVKLDTVRSDDVCDAPTVYVPLNVVPADAAVNSTVAPVSSVTVSVLPDWTASLIVAVMLTVCPALYAPSTVDDKNDDTVGAVASMVTDVDDDVDEVVDAASVVVAVAVML
jgi:hypothetical protein